jgi:hypothetical protein
MPAFLLPDLGEGPTEAEIVTWRVQAGDVAAVDQTVVEVETAKKPWSRCRSLRRPGDRPARRARRRAGRRGTADHGRRGRYRARHVTNPGQRHVTNPGHGYRASRHSVRGARRRHAGRCGQR